MKRHKNFLSATSRLRVLAGLFLALITSLQPAPGVVPYVNDGNTVLLDHLDGSTSGSPLGYYADTGPCGGQRPATGPSMSFPSGPNGLSAALQLCHLSGAPEGNGSYLRYNGELLSRPNGTLEFWIYLTSYGSGLSLVEQGPYYGACAGWTFGLSLGTNGVISAGAWAAFSFNSGNNVVPLNRWTHLALSWGSAGAKLYMDGQLAGADANTGQPAAGFGGNLMFRIGSHTPNLCSIMDEIRISNIQRTSFNVPTPAPLTNMKAYAGFTITGNPGTPCQVDYAPALGNTNNWQILTNFTLPSKPYIFIDFNSTNVGSRFYRATFNP